MEEENDRRVVEKMVNSLPQDEDPVWIYSDQEQDVRFKPMDPERKVVGGRLQQLRCTETKDSSANSEKK